MEDIIKNISTLLTQANKEHSELNAKYQFTLRKLESALAEKDIYKQLNAGITPTTYTLTTSSIKSIHKQLLDKQITVDSTYSWINQLESLKPGDILLIHRPTWGISGYIVVDSILSFGKSEDKRVTLNIKYLVLSKDYILVQQIKELLSKEDIEFNGLTKMDFEDTLKIITKIGEGYIE